MYVNLKTLKQISYQSHRLHIITKMELDKNNISYLHGLLLLLPIYGSSHSFCRLNPSTKDITTPVGCSVSYEMLHIRWMDHD